MESSHTLLVHETKSENLDEFIRDQAIRSARNVNAAKFKTARYANVYLGVLFKFLSMFPSNISRTIGGDHFRNKLVLFFTDDLMAELPPTCWNPNWRFGDCSKKGSIRYNPRISPSENIALWQAAYMPVYTATPTALGRPKAAHTLYVPIESLGQNEVVFPMAIPFRYCVGVFQLGGDKAVLSRVTANAMTDVDELAAFLRLYGYSAHD
jgi:hypothetical protein